MQRAARFIKANAARYGIEPGRLGGWGGSSGAYMVSMLGVIDGGGDAGSVDAVERQSSALARVVAFAAPTDMLVTQSTMAHRFEAFAGAPLDASRTGGTPEHNRYVAASPLTYVSAGDAAFYLVHGDADDIVPVMQSEQFAAALAKVGVPMEFRRVAGAGHPLILQPDARAVAQGAARWLGACLRN
jgi:acetyl esterase/lipase